MHRFKGAVRRKIFYSIFILIVNDERVHKDSKWVHKDSKWVHKDSKWVHKDSKWVHKDSKWVQGW